MAYRTLCGWRRLVASVLAVLGAAQAAAVSLPPSNRVTINLGETPWRYLKDKTPVNVTSPSYDDTAANKVDLWSDVGVPQTPADNDTFLNIKSGGGQGQLTGNILWYRKHFKLDASYANRKVFVEFEGAHMGAQVYINGNLMPTNSLVNPQATHVVGFVPFIVDLTPYVKFDGSDNVMAVKVARGDAFFTDPDFSGAFRFGQADSGLFRPVWMTIEDRVHIPHNTWSTLNTWGTYVSTLSANDAQALVRVQTNVRNEYASTQTVTLTTQIVDAGGNVVTTAQDTKAIASNPLPLVPAKIAPETAPPPATFDQTLTVPNPTLWYPNNSSFGKPTLYTVIHTVSINGIVVDATRTPLGIRTIAWDQNFPIINGHAHYLWGASGRYDYPALGSAMPEEAKWRDVELLAEAGGSLYRPGHSGEGPEFIAAGDAYGVMLIQPSGDGENGFANLCPNNFLSDRPAGCNANGTDMELKKETHRDMIVHDRNNPSILAWEADNGATDTSFAQALKALSRTWDPVLTHAQTDRTPNPANGDVLGCSGDGCDVGVKSTYPNSPVWGSEYWGDGVKRTLYDWELQFAVNPLSNWSKGVKQKVFGISHWYLADTPGEITTQVDGPGSQHGLPTGTTNFEMRGNAASMTDANRFPRLLYYMYQAAWTPYDLKPVVRLGYHWNRVGNVTVNAFSNCPAVRLLINGQQQGADQVPNPQTMDVGSDTGPNTVSLPRQVHWNVSWAAGTLSAECVDANGRVVTDGANKPVADTKVTAGPADHIALSAAPELVRPDGTPFQLTANGTDAAFVTAKVVDAAGNLVPDASPIVTFAVTTPATGTYRGGADSFVSFQPGQVPLEDMSNALPQGYHAPGDPNLFAEGGLAKVAVRATFTPGTVTVTASAPGLKSGSASFTTHAISGPPYTGGALVVPGQPAGALAIVQQPLGATVAAGQTASFTVLSSGSGTLSYQWKKGGVAIAGATGFSYTTPATVIADNGTNFSVVVSNGTTSVPSNPAILTVVPPSIPTIVTQPQPQTTIAGQSAEFSVAANGSPVLKYQWRKNGVDIAGANNPVYDTPAAVAADDGANFSVVVSNTAGATPSNAARLTVAAAIKPSIVTQPLGRAVGEGQSVSFTVVASGSTPLNYQWTLNGANVGTNSDTYTIGAAQTTDAGNYQVTVSNAAGSTQSALAVLSVSGSSGPNLALGKTTFESSEQNAGLSSKFAVDGDRTVSRWSSQQVDDSSMGVDLGALTTFDRVVLYWEAAYAAQYLIEVSSDNKTWTPVGPAITGHGGVETINFPSTSARYVRMHGQVRGSPYGYSLYEFEVYDVPQCGGTTERYTPLPPQTGTWHSTIPGLPDGPYVPNVIDNLSHLTWQQYVTTFPDEGAQFIQSTAIAYCQAVGMRLPTQAEALSIAGANYASCGFPNPWTTWTTTPVAGQSGRAYFVSSAGVSSSQIIDNSPGWALCVSGTALAAPVITTQMTNQTAAVGATATFSVVVSGAQPMTFQWFENGNQVGLTSVPSFTTAALTTADDQAVFTVTVSNAGGSANGSSAKLTVTTTGTTKYAITASAGANGTIAPSGTVKVAQGANQAFTIAPAAGYLVSDVSVDGASVGAVTTYTFTDVEAKHTIAASFAPVSTMVNLALHQPATSTALEADVYPASAAVDGDAVNTRWSSAKDDAAWITVDLGAVKNVSRVILRWENAYGKSYKIQLSKDNVDWSDTVFSTTTGDGGIDDIAFPEAAARYVRMQGVLRGTGYGYSLYEFEVYDTAATGLVFATQPQNKSVAVGATARFSVTMSGSGPFTYQWRKNGTKITGATNASYTTPAVTSADNGSKYDVIVKSGGLSATSNTAKLTVK
jgi:beta-galactosidase